MRIVYWARLQLAKSQIIAGLQAEPGIELTITATLAETLAALPGAAALILVHGPQHEAEQVFAALRAPDNTVRWLHFLSAGREGYEELGYPPGIVVSYAGGGVAPAVAEHAMALLLAIARRLPEVVTKVMGTRTWDRLLVNAHARSLEGATLAIVGFGHIGREVAKRARGFDMRVVTVSRTPRPEPGLVDEARPLADLHRVLAEADAVVVAIAQTPETEHLLGEAEFACCKPGALLVNVARGRVIDQAALGRALASGRIAAAGLDVCDPEPLPADDPLWDCPNVLISPHYAASGSSRSIDRLAGGVIENLRRLRGGEPLLHVVSEGG